MTRRLVAENWRLERARYTLLGSFCNGCKNYHFPTKELCLNCKSSSELEDYRFKGTGKLVEWTTVYEAARGFEAQVPYHIGIIELEEGIRITAQLTGVKDSSELEYDMPVKMVFRKLFSDGREGLVTYGFKAIPNR